jgi:hypothetical protein
MGKIIGNKEAFGIEYEFTDHSEFHNAKTRIWCRNSYMGNFEDDSPVYGVYHYLNYFITNKDKFITNEFKGKAKEEIYKMLIPYNTKEEYWKLPENVVGKLSDYDKYSAGFNEAYDEFTIRMFIEDDMVCFLWKIEPSEYSLSIKKYLDYKRDLYYHHVPFEKVKNVVEEFKSDLIKEGALKE